MSTPEETQAIPQLLEDLTKLASSYRETMEHAQGLESKLQSKEAEIASLKAEADKPVVLQKVAMSQPAIERTLDVLVNRALLATEDREKVAAQILDNPEVALRLIEQVATISNNLPVANTGVGIEKEAGATITPDTDDGFGPAGDWLEA